MNWQAFLDGVLAIAALWVALHHARRQPAIRLACLILAAAAVLGTLRFSGILSLPPLHQTMSMLGATTALPLLAIALAWPTGAVATARRDTWIVAVALASFAVLLVIVGQFKFWSPLCSVLSAAAIIGTAVSRRQWLVAAAGMIMLAAFAAFSAGLNLAALRPGDFLHAGLAAALLLIAHATVKSDVPAVTQA